MPLDQLPPPPGPAAGNEAALALVAAELARIRYGAIRLTVRDGVIAEFELVEKRRFA